LNINAQEAEKKAPDLVVAADGGPAKGKYEMAKASLQRAETLLHLQKNHCALLRYHYRRMVDPGAFIPAATSGSAAQNAALVTLTDFNRVRVQVAVPNWKARLSPRASR